jgi:crotonobetainyl-CoA:carnitine CoA-transferase CaiB-like acyl-CoA transferase
MIELLKGVRVVESAMLLNGATVGMRLADLGADVIKVERPGIGDYGRTFGGQIAPGYGLLDLQVNKNKRSISLNLRSEAGKSLFWRLLDTADVFLDGNAADACEKLGIGYNEQKRHKPGIVYCQYTGFGGSGPYASLPTHGQMMDALAGAQRREMGDDGLLEIAPPDVDSTVTGGEGTAAGAIHAAFAVAAGLFHSVKTGEGCYIDVAGFEGVMAQGWVSTVQALNRHRFINADTMPNPQRLSESAKYQFYETSDKKVLLFCAMEPKFWENFCQGIERADLIERQSGSMFDLGDGIELRETLQSIFHERSLAEWVALAVDNDVPLGPAPRTTFEALQDPHVQARQMSFEGVHPAAGPITYVGPAGKVMGQTYEVTRHAPAHGENTIDVLHELGIAETEIEELLRDGVV